MRILLVASAVWLSVVALGAQLGDPTHETTTPDVAGLTPDSSTCPLSTDETYGLTIGNPIMTGGGNLCVATCGPGPLLSSAGRLTEDSRAAIVEILHDTKPDLPSYFQPLRRTSR